jgi:beta-xylosidase
MTLRKTFRNPILTGFYPDPSICRVGDDYYLVNSTFEYFPGLPVFHSRDLVHWHQIGHALDRASQLPLEGVRPSGGLYAPTIRFSNGTFYVINTLVDGRILSTPVAGGFVGAYIAMYASSNGQPGTNHADFDWFEYIGLDES